MPTYDFFTHPRFVALVCALDMPRAHVWGMIGLLEQYLSCHAPDGALAVTDRVLERIMEFPGRPGEMAAALRSEDVSLLIVTDGVQRWRGWPEHAPAHVKDKLRKRASRNVRDKSGRVREIPCRGEERRGEVQDSPTSLTPPLAQSVTSTPPVFSSGPVPARAKGASEDEKQRGGGGARSGVSEVLDMEADDAAGREKAEAMLRAALARDGAESAAGPFATWPPSRQAAYMAEIAGVSSAGAAEIAEAASTGAGFLAAVWTFRAFARRRRKIKSPGGWFRVAFDKRLEWVTAAGSAGPGEAQRPRGATTVADGVARRASGL